MIKNLKCIFSEKIKFKNDQIKQKYSDYINKTIQDDYNSKQCDPNLFIVQSSHDLKRPILHPRPFLLSPSNPNFLLFFPLFLLSPTTHPLVSYTDIIYSLKLRSVLHTSPGIYHHYIETNLGLVTSTCIFIYLAPGSIFGKVYSRQGIQHRIRVNLEYGVRSTPFSRTFRSI